MQSNHTVVSDGNDNLYLNVVINPDPRNPSKWTPCIYSDNLNIPILGDPSKYYGSIVRFTVPLDGIPLMLFPVDVKDNNPNLSNLFIGITNSGGTNFPFPLIYVPQNVDTPPTPFFNPGTGDYFNDTQASLPYYYIYSIQQVIKMINIALNNALIASGIVVTAAPFYTYDPVSQLISLHVGNDLVQAGATIFVNNNLHNYLSSFQWFSNAPLGNSLISKKDYTQIYDVPNSVGVTHVIPQDFVSMSLWFDLRKIIITSNSLPVRSEIVPALGSGGVSANLPIVTDFAVTFSSASQVHEVAVYNPSAQYRLIDMISTNPISRIQFSFQWEDKFGTVFPIYISPLQQASLKMGFFKKSLYNSQHSH